MFDGDLLADRRRSRGCEARNERADPACLGEGGDVVAPPRLAATGCTGRDGGECREEGSDDEQLAHDPDPPERDPRTPPATGHPGATRRSEPVVLRCRGATRVD